MPLQECHKEVNVAVNGATTNSCLKIRLQNILYNVKSPP